MANNRSEYYVLWYDPKMKNYLLFLEYLRKKRMIQAKITSILVVDKYEQLLNVEKIKAESVEEKQKADVIVMSRKVYTDEEQLLRTFSQQQSQEQ